MNTLRRAWPAAVLGLLLAGAAAAPAHADDDPPGRVGRLAELRGHVWRYDDGQGAWVAANPNRPVTGGDRLATDDDARAELRVGSTTLRLGAGSELEVRRLDDARLSVELRRGELALRVRSHEAATEADIVTDEVRLQPLRSGLYRVDRIDDSTYAGTWRGALQVGEGGEAFTLVAGQRAELWRDGRHGALQNQASAMPRDGFADWVARADAADDRGIAYRYVSPEMTGAEDLDANGRWQQVPEVGPVWVPTVVAPDWAPYRYGHWAWVPPWGWTWIDDAPWGFAPFHYGRWLVWGGRWCWSPGAYRPRPVYAPALVAWVGGSGFSVSVGVGGALQPAVGWVPLAPHEPFVPYYRASRDYDDRLNHRPPGDRRPEPPAEYRNQQVPGAVTVVPRQVIDDHQPVSRGWVRGVEPDGPGRTGRPGPGFAPAPPPPPPPAAREGWRRAQPMRPPSAYVSPPAQAPRRQPELQPPSLPQPQPQPQPQSPPRAQLPSQPQPQPQPQPQAQTRPMPEGRRGRPEWRQSLPVPPAPVPQPVPQPVQPPVPRPEPRMEPRPEFRGVPVRPMPMPMPNSMPTPRAEPEFRPAPAPVQRAAPPPPPPPPMPVVRAAPLPPPPPPPPVVRAAPPPPPPRAVEHPSEPRPERPPEERRRIPAPGEKPTQRE